MHISRLPTPALIVEESALMSNIAAMKKLLDGSSLALRPHYKSHKCAALAHLQMQNGAKGMTCAKLSEAIDLADSGITDILIANQITDPAKIRAAADLAGDCRLTLCADDAGNIRALSRAAKNAGTVIHVLIEYDIGMERCGVTDPAQVLALAGQIQSESHLVFDGIQAYAGHVSHTVDPVERAAETAANSARVRELLSLLKANGIDCPTVSGGSTGTAALKARDGLYTELQAGSYLFMDATYRDLKLPFVNSLFVLSTVISRRPGLTVVDAGVKTCGVDQGMPAICEGGADPIVASEEHFQLHNPTFTASLGERIRLIPGHCCSTVNLHDKLYIVDRGQVVDRLAITARGIGR